MTTIKKRGIELNMKEQEKYEIVKDYVDLKINNHKRLADQLGCSVKHTYVLIDNYEKYGKEAFRHKSRGRVSSKKTPQSIVDNIIQIYESISQGDINFTHFQEILEETYNIKISYQTLWSILTKVDYYSPKMHKTTKNKLKLKLKQSTLKEQKTIVNKNYFMNPKDVHCRIPKPKNSGEIVELDASLHPWFGRDRPQIYLHACIDRATGRITGAYFSEQETTLSYYIVLKQMIMNYGVPMIIVTDNRTSFGRLLEKGTERENMANFAITCRRLTIELSSTSIPQKKGRIERLFQTLQSRLSVELRLKGIKTIDEANIFLQEYIEIFNESRFEVFPINYTTNVFAKLDENTNIDDYLATYKIRIVDNGNTIKYNKKYYYLFDKNHKQVFPKNRVEVLVIATLDNRLYASIDKDMYYLIECEKQQKYSSIFDTIKPERKKWIPPMTHPYKKLSYDIMMQSKQLKQSQN